MLAQITDGATWAILQNEDTERDESFWEDCGQFAVPTEMITGE